MRTFAALAAAALALWLGAGAERAGASWPGGGPSGTANAKALSLPAGPTPSVSVTGRDVTVSWSAATISGQPVSGYVVKRYDGSNQLQSMGTGCSGTVTATSCTEAAVPAGTWTYKIAPRHGNWTGSDGSASSPATVGAPALAFSSSTTVTTLPTTLTGTLSNFVTGSTVTYRLDNSATGTVLTGTTTPSSIPTGGGASVSVTVPSGTSNGAHTVYAIGSDGSVASAAITVSAASCPTSYPTLTWLSGMEHAYSTTAGGGVWNSAAGTATVDSTVKRNGTYSLKIAPTAAIAYRGRLLGIGENVWVVRFAIRLASLPSANTELATLNDSNHVSTTSYMTLRYIAASQKFAIGFPGQTVLSSGTVTAGNWYVIDMRLDPRGTTQTADWRVDGVAQTSTSLTTGAAGAAYAINFGSTSAATFSANYDDIAISETNADYPIGDGKVLPLRLDGMGTSVGAASFVNDDATAINSTSWSRLDEIPMGAGTDFVKQTATSTTNYVEMTFEDTTETCVRAVGGRVVYDPQNTNQANDGRTALLDGTTERTIHDGNMAANNAIMNPKYGTVAPLGAAWTATELNGLRARIGYSSDASPNPTWHSLMLEYDVPL